MQQSHHLKRVQQNSTINISSHKSKNMHLAAHVSLEALAMADVDHVSFGLDGEEWERREFESPPPHLLAEEEEDQKEETISNDDKEEGNDNSTFDRYVTKKKNTVHDSSHRIKMKRYLKAWVNKVVVEATNNFKAINNDQVRRDGHFKAGFEGGFQGSLTTPLPVEKKI